MLLVIIGNSNNGNYVLDYSERRDLHAAKAIGLDLNEKETFAHRCNTMKIVNENR